MPRLIKIGYTCGQVSERLDKLNSTGVPIPFDVVACYLVNNPVEIERKIHLCLEKYRFSKNREFFEVSTSDAIEKTIPIIVGNLCDNGGDDDSIGSHSELSHGLEENSILILQSLADVNRNQGYDIHTIASDIKESEVEAINRLANLKEMGLVDERKSREEWRGSIWKITSKGVKFIFDHGLVEEYMKRSHL